MCVRLLHHSNQFLIKHIAGKGYFSPLHTQFDQGKFRKTILLYQYLIYFGIHYRNATYFAMFLYAHIYISVFFFGRNYAGATIPESEMLSIHSDIRIKRAEKKNKTKGVGVLMNVK